MREADIQRAVQFTIPGETVPWARSGTSGKRHYTPQRQADFMTSVRLIAAAAMRGAKPLSGPLSVDIRAVYLVPDSWSKKQRAIAYWKASKPDADNVAKIIQDAVKSIVYGDDAQIAHLNIIKVYGPVAGVRVIIEELWGVVTREAS